MNNRNGGCLSGLIELLLLGWLFDWLEDKFGFGRGCSCSGCSCGIILLILFLLAACSIFSGINWGHLGF